MIGRKRDRSGTQPGAFLQHRDAKVSRQNPASSFARAVRGAQPQFPMGGVDRHDASISIIINLASTRGSNIQTKETYFKHLGNRPNGYVPAVR